MISDASYMAFKHADLEKSKGLLKFVLAIFNHSSSPILFIADLLYLTNPACRST